MTTPLLEVEDLRILYTKDGVAVPAVNGASFSLQPGECLGIVGESGSGKSLSALAIIGLLPTPPMRIESGSIRLNGEEIAQASERAMGHIRGRRIAMIFQEPMTCLNPLQTIGNQICESLRIHKGLRGRPARERAVELLEQVGVPDAVARLKAYPHLLSGGLRQRAMIAIALAGDPDLLIADEPTTALDVTIQAQVLKLLRRLSDERGMGIVLITHDLGVVSEVADQVAVLYSGRVVERGATRDLLRNPAHPYTHGLLKSVPRLRGPKGSLHPMPGLVPPLGQTPSGCPFHPRCPHAIEVCRTDVPLGILPGAKQGSACWRADDLLNVRAPA